MNQIIQLCPLTKNSFLALTSDGKIYRCTLITIGTIWEEVDSSDMGDAGKPGKKKL